MLASRHLHGHFLKSLQLLIRSNMTPQLNGGSTTTTKSSCPTVLHDVVGWFHLYSTARGRGMRAKVEKRMWKESAKTQMEQRRSKRIHKMLMTEEERLIYNLRRAKKKVALLLQKLKKYELPELPPPQHDPELLTAEQLQAYKKIGFRNRNYVPVGVRGVFGGVVQNMHLHWKFHETVQVCCDNFPKEKIKEMATMLARLSGGIVVNIHNVKTIIMFRGRNYRQPKNLIPINTLTKRKALFKARFEQALESQKLNIKKIEQQLRRKGISPEDPIAMASIQKVAATFFRAIDEKQGTPYVFRGENAPMPEANNRWVEDEPTDITPEYSDQEELDKFIAEIEQAADLEWEKEEAAEKEEASRIRYWGKDDSGYGLRGRNINSLESVDENRDRRGHWTVADSVHRTNKLQKWEEDEDIEDPSDGEEWVSDDEVSNAIGHIDSDVAISSDTEEETSDSWITRGREGDERLRGITTNVDDSSNFEMLGASDGEISESEEENGESSVKSVYDDREKNFGHSGHDRIRPIDSKKKNFDENWDID